MIPVIIQVRRLFFLPPVFQPVQDQAYEDHIVDSQHDFEDNQYQKTDNALEVNRCSITDEMRV